MDYIKIIYEFYRVSLKMKEKYEGLNTLAENAEQQPLL